MGMGPKPARAELTRCSTTTPEMQGHPAQLSLSSLQLDVLGLLNLPEGCLALVMGKMDAQAKLGLSKAGHCGRCLLLSYAARLVPHPQSRHELLADLLEVPPGQPCFKALSLHLHQGQWGAAAVPDSSAAGRPSARAGSSSASASLTRLLVRLADAFVCTAHCKCLATHIWACTRSLSLLASTPSFADHC